MCRFLDDRHDLWETPTLKRDPKTDHQTQSTRQLHEKDGREQPGQRPGEHDRKISQTERRNWLHFSSQSNVGTAPNGSSQLKPGKIWSSAQKLGSQPTFNRLAQGKRKPIGQPLEVASREFVHHNESGRLQKRVDRQPGGQLHQHGQNPGHGEQSGEIEWPLRKCDHETHEPDCGACNSLLIQIDQSWGVLAVKAASEPAKPAVLTPLSQSIEAAFNHSAEGGVGEHADDRSIGGILLFVELGVGTLGFIRLLFTLEVPDADLQGAHGQHGAHEQLGQHSDPRGPERSRGNFLPYQDNDRRVVQHPGQQPRKEYQQQYESLHRKLVTKTKTRKAQNRLTRDSGKVLQQRRSIALNQKSLELHQSAEKYEGISTIEQSDQQFSVQKIADWGEDHSASQQLAHNFSGELIVPGIDLVTYNAPAQRELAAARGASRNDRIRPRVGAKTQFQTSKRDTAGSSFDRSVRTESSDEKQRRFKPREALNGRPNYKPQERHQSNQFSSIQQISVVEQPEYRLQGQKKESRRSTDPPRAEPNFEKTVGVPHGHSFAAGSQVTLASALFRKLHESPGNYRMAAVGRGLPQQTLAAVSNANKQKRHLIQHAKGSFGPKSQLVGAKFGGPPSGTQRQNSVALHQHGKEAQADGDQHPRGHHGSAPVKSAFVNRLSQNQPGKHGSRLFQSNQERGLTQPDAGDKRPPLAALNSTSEQEPSLSIIDDIKAQSKVKGGPLQQNLENRRLQVFNLPKQSTHHRLAHLEQNSIRYKATGDSGGVKQQSQEQWHATAQGSQQAAASFKQPVFSGSNKSLYQAAKHIPQKRQQPRPSAAELPPVRHDNYGPVGSATPSRVAKVPKQAESSQHQAHSFLKLINSTTSVGGPHHPGNHAFTAVGQSYSKKPGDRRESSPVQHAQTPLNLKKISKKMARRDSQLIQTQTYNSPQQVTVMTQPSFFCQDSASAAKMPSKVVAKHKRHKSRVQRADSL